MSITTPSLVESMLLHDRPAAWWGLDTADPLVDDSGNGYTLTAVGTPSNAASLHTRGDTGDSGCRDFNGTTGGYTTPGSLTTVADGPPAFHAAATAKSAAATTLDVVSPGGIQEGDLLLFVTSHATQTATITTGPSGYTQVGSTQNATNHALAVYRKTAVESDTVPQEVTVVWSASAAVDATLLVYRGCDPDVSTLIFDFGQGVTASDTFHSTSTETFPDRARQIVVWTADGVLFIDPDQTNGTERVDIVNGNLGMIVMDYTQEEAGSGFRVATTTANTTMGYFIITFGSPEKVLEDILDTVSEDLTIHCLVNPDTVAAGTRTIIRKHQSWGLNINGAALQFVYRDGGGVDRTVTGPNLSASTTQRLWVVDDGTNVNFYVNGTKTTAARTGTAGYTVNENAVTIAHYNNGATTEFYDGRIDELAVFPAAFNAAMVIAQERAHTQGLFGNYITANDSGFYPRAKLELAIDSRPTDRCYVYTDVTGDTRTEAGIGVTRGRNFELDRMQAGTMEFVLNNRDTAYDDLAPRRVVRFRAQVTTDGPVYPIFYGYTEAPKYRRPHSGRDSTVEITATDSFKALSVNKIQDSFVRPSEMPEVRIDAVLENVPGSLIVSDEAVHEIIGDDLQGVNRLEHCQAVAETDGGIFFADALGRFNFQSNQYRSKNERTVRATYGGINTSAPYPCKLLEPEIDESRLFTGAAVTPSSGNVQRVDHDTAHLDYFPLIKEVTTLHSLDVDALAMATHIANAYSTPLPRILNFTVQPAAKCLDSLTAGQTMWSTVLGHEISHRIETVEKPIGATVETSREHFIEGIVHAINSNDWQVTLPVSPTELEGNYFIIGTSQIGDANAVIGW